MSLSVCIHRISEIKDEHLKFHADKKELICCATAMQHILWSSDLYFCKLKVLKQPGTCSCSYDWVTLKINKPERLPLLQLIKTKNDNMPLMIHRMDYHPRDCMTVFYLLAKNKLQLSIKTTLYLCLRRTTCLDKNVVKIICSFVNQDMYDNDWCYLHALALNENLVHFNQETHALNETKRLVTFDVKKSTEGFPFPGTHYSKKFLIKLDDEIYRVKVEIHHLQRAIQRLLN